MKITRLFLAAVVLGATLVHVADAEPPAVAIGAVEPLQIGETFVLESAVLEEARRINVYLPAAYEMAPDSSFGVLYMPDGGIHEDFLHIAGLVQIGSLNGTMRPVVLVGIENTERRRDLTGPTSDPRDREIAPRVGGSAQFRRFLRTELMPAVRARYRTSDEAAIIGESLAGLFVVETLLEAPELFDRYIAIDPSLWWDGERLVETALEIVGRGNRPVVQLFLAASTQKGILEPTRRLADLLASESGVATSYEEYTGETHQTIYHPAALDALRKVFADTQR